MKKSFAIIITVCLVLTGCGSTKTLECTISNSSNNLTYIFEYSNNKINKANLDYSMDTSNSYNPDGFNELLESYSLKVNLKQNFLIVKKIFLQKLNQFMLHLIWIDMIEVLPMI